LLEALYAGGGDEGSAKVGAPVKSHAG
jgi:hypothetical protein